MWFMGKGLFCVLMEVCVGPWQGEGWPVLAPLDLRGDRIDDEFFQTPFPRERSAVSVETLMPAAWRRWRLPC